MDARPYPRLLNRTIFVRERQWTICQLIKNPCSWCELGEIFNPARSTPFLLLPPCIRRQIYLYAGIPINSEIVLLPHPQYHTDRFARDSPVRWNPPATSSILAVSRKINEEVSSIVYTKNQFHFKPEKASDLEYFRCLRPQVVSCLRRLSVHLHVNYDSRQKIGHCSCRFSYPVSKAGHCPDSDIHELTPAFRALLHCWQTALRHLLHHMQPKRLRLSITCDVASQELALPALSPLMELEHPRLLADCAIRLSRKRDPILQSLARRVVEHAVGLTTHACPSTMISLLDLPSELRRTILEYTDLVTPLKEVYWNSKFGFHTHYCFYRCEPPRLISAAEDSDDEVSRFCDEREARWSNHHYHHACQFRWCKGSYCLPRGDGAFISDRPDTQSSTAFTPGQQKELFKRFSGCFCRVQHAAYTSPSNCRCWRPPTALFLVCRTMRDEAEIIFFEQNKMIIMPHWPGKVWWGPWETPPAAPDRFDACIFIDRLRASALRSMRSIEIVFPPFKDDYCPAKSKTHQDWKRTMSALSQSVNLYLLSVRVHAVDHSPEDGVQEKDVSDFRRTMDDHKALEIIQTYHRLLEPFTQYSALKHLSFHLAWPWTWSPRVDRGGWMQNIQQRERQAAEVSSNIANKIIGRDTYTKLSHGDAAAPESQWILNELPPSEW